jgi:hypothetical protein
MHNAGTDVTTGAVVDTLQPRPTIPGNPAATRFDTTQGTIDRTAIPERLRTQTKITGSTVIRDRQPFKDRHGSSVAAFLKRTQTTPTDPGFNVSFFPECQRLHGIVEGVVSSDKMTSTPRKIISSSINNLTVWYGERDPISYRLHLSGNPCHHPTAHIPQI